MTDTTTTSSRRTFLPEQIEISGWEDIKPYYDKLIERELPDKAALLQWLHDRSELDAFVQEFGAWRNINVTRNTADAGYRQDYEDYVKHIVPYLRSASHRLDKKLLNAPSLKMLDSSEHRFFIQKVRQEAELYCEENLPLQTEQSLKAKQYGDIVSRMSINHNGKTLTLPQTKPLLEDADREVRRRVFEKVQDRRLQDRKVLDDLFTELVQLRHQIAKNAGYDNYRDYKFAALNRFEYGPEDCFTFHDAIKQEVLPVMRKLQQQRRDALGLKKLRPWDTTADPSGKLPLKPFDNVEDLVDKTIQCFYRLDPYFGDCLQAMDKKGHLDLETRKNKAPGGYNCPLHETGMPFIFTNAGGTVSDLITLVHEGGHAVHSFLTKELELVYYKALTSEIAELASMSMELFSMGEWNIFFEQKSDLRRAQWQQLERVVSIFPWVATIDKFQHWIYTHPDHTSKQRQEAWKAIFSEFSTGVEDWSGYEDAMCWRWQAQLHLYEVPFYYIEYAMAELGSIAMWRQFRDDPKQALSRYKAALRMGYSRPIPEVFEVGGIKFDFSRKYVGGLMRFVREEIARIQRS